VAKANSQPLPANRKFLSLHLNLNMTINQTRHILGVVEYSHNANALGFEFG
jgi:hypothetical protein